MIDDTCVLLSCSAKEARNVHEGQDLEARNVHEGQDLDIEGVAETNETRCFTACVAVQYSGKPRRLVSDDTGRTTIETSETADDVLRVILVNLHEITIVNNRVDDLMHVVRFVRISRNDVVQVVIHAGDVIGACNYRSFLHIVLRDERDDVLQQVPLLR